MKNYEKTLKDKYLRPTAMRILVLEYLESQSAAKSLSDMEVALGHADRITIYRTLKTFEEKGVIHKIIDGSDAAKYALCSLDCNENHHHDMHVHFNCNVCHETFCLTSSKIRLPDIPVNFTAEEVNLVVKSICPKCKR